MPIKQNGKTGEIFESVHRPVGEKEVKLVKLVERVNFTSNIERWRVIGNGVFNRADGRSTISLGAGWRKREIGHGGEVWANGDNSRVVELLKLVANQFSGEEWETKVLVGDKTATRITLPSAWHRLIAGDVYPKIEKIEKTCQPTKCKDGDCHICDEVKAAKKKKWKDAARQPEPFPIGVRLRFKKGLIFGRENLVCRVISYTATKAYTTWTDGASVWGYNWTKKKLGEELERFGKSLTDFPVGSKWDLKNRKGVWCEVVAHSTSPELLKLRWHSPIIKDSWINEWSVGSAETDLVPYVEPEKYPVGTKLITKIHPLVADTTIGEVTTVTPDKILIRWSKGNIGLGTSWWTRAEIESRMMPYEAKLAFIAGSKLMYKNGHPDENGCSLWCEVLEVGQTHSKVKWHGVNAGQWTGSVLNASANELLTGFVDTVGKAREIWQDIKLRTVRLSKYLGKDPLNKDQEEWEAVCVCGCYRKLAIILPGPWIKVA